MGLGAPIHSTSMSPRSFEGSGPGVIQGDVESLKPLSKFLVPPVSLTEICCFADFALTESAGLEGAACCSDHIYRGLMLDLSPYYVCSFVILIFVLYFVWEFRLCVLAWLCHICLIPVSLLSFRDLLGNRKQMECLGETACRES